MWTCPKCATKVDPSFEVCWNCGTTEDGVEDPDFRPADAESPSESPLDLDMPEGDVPIPEVPSELGGELVECYWALDLMQAKFLADQLTEAGIPAMADTQDMHDQFASQSSGPRVWVREVDQVRAKLWLEEFDRRNQAEHGGVG
jgi:hypothetical protein